MAKKIYYYKFLIKLDRKLKDFEVKSIKNAIKKVLIDTPITNIQGGEANNNGYHKFKTEDDFKLDNKRC
jgi:hypothetical protein